MYTCFRAATELTFVPRGQSRNGEDVKWLLRTVDVDKLKADTLSCRHSSNYLYTPNDHQIIKQLNPRFFIDCGCVEVEHLPCIYDEYLSLLYKAIYQAAEKQNLVPVLIRETQRTKRYHPTGGGHIHVDVPFHYFKEESFIQDFGRFERSLINDVTNNPYLTWLFRLPFNDTIRNFPYYQEYALGGRYDNAPVIPRYRGARMRTRIPTYEFRMFDAPATPEMASAHVKFVKYWVAYIGSLTYSDKSIPISITEPKYKKYIKSLREVQRGLKKLLTRNQTPELYEVFEPYFENYIIRQKNKALI